MGLERFYNIFVSTDTSTIKTMTFFENEHYKPKIFI